MVFRSDLFRTHIQHLWNQPQGGSYWIGCCFNHFPPSLFSLARTFTFFLSYRCTTEWQNMYQHSPAILKFNWTYVIFILFCMLDVKFINSDKKARQAVWCIHWSNSCYSWSLLASYQVPYPSVLDFWKIKLGKSSLMNWIFSLFQTGFLLPV